MQNAMSFYTDDSKNAVGIRVFSPEMPGTISHRLPAEIHFLSGTLGSSIFQIIPAAIDLG